MIQAIETKYKGYRFRSRLEARWAVFFDALAIKWEYEPEGFVLSDGTRYLPDFYLPTFNHYGMYVEVKPDGGDFSKARKFCSDSGRQVWLAEGTPSERAWLWLSPCDPTVDVGQVAELTGIPNADQAWGENRMFTEPGYEKKDMTIEEYALGCLGEDFREAVRRAKSARFEHGECALVIG